MKKLLLAAAFALAFASSANAQCVGAGNTNVNALPGMNCNSESIVPSFMAMGYGIAPAASATDVACITGSASRVTRVQGVRVSGTAGTLVTLPILLNKHTVANTGGTAATTTALPVPVKLDSASAAATATTTAYTANPTIDSTAAQIDAIVTSLNTTSALVNGTQAFFDFKARPFAMAPVLRGVAQQVCVNLGGISVSSGLLAISFYWTEAPQ